MLKKILKKPYLILPNIKFLLKESTEKKKINFVKSRKIIWHFSSHKSLSSDLTKAIGIAPNNITLDFDNNYGNKYASFNEKSFTEKIESYNFFLPKRIEFLCSHSHTIFDDSLSKYFSTNHKVLIQYRNIYDTISCLVDYLYEKKKIKEQHFFFETKKRLNKNIIFKKLLYTYVPFHINFIRSWFNCKINAKKIFIPDEKLFQNTEKFFKIIDEKNFLHYSKNNIFFSKKNYFKCNSQFYLKKNDKMKITKIVDSILNFDEKKIKEIIFSG